MATRFRSRLLALVPANAGLSKARAHIARHLETVREHISDRVRDALDLPSRDELTRALDRILTLDRQIDALRAEAAIATTTDHHKPLAQKSPHPSAERAPSSKPPAESPATLKPTSKEPTINVGSPKSMIDHVQKAQYQREQVSTATEAYGQPVPTLQLSLHKKDKKNKKSEKALSGRASKHKPSQPSPPHISSKIKNSKKHKSSKKHKRSKKHKK